MHILGLVAADTGARCTGEGERCVTLGTTDWSMQPDQRIARQGMIKSQAGLPVGLAMTAVARLVQLAAVRIDTSMTIHAGLAELLSGDLGGVTGIAGDFSVRPDEGKLVTAGVIVIGDLPVAVVVTVLAAGPEARRVRIVGTMTAVTVLRDLLLVVAAAMAGQTINIAVRAQQRIAGFLEVIVFGRLPLLGDMALGAIGSS